MEEEPSQLALQLDELMMRVAELGDNRANLTAIADWSAATYVTPGEDRVATVERIQEYLKDALVTVTQQIAASGTALTGFLDQQLVELHMVDSTIRLLENRLSSQKEHLARQAMLTQFMRKLPVRGAAEEPEEPPEKLPVFRNQVRTADSFVRGSHHPRSSPPATSSSPPPLTRQGLRTQLPPPILTPPSAPHPLPYISTRMA